MSEKRFRTNDLVKFNYSEIGEYVDENHTDKPLRNDEVVDLLNEQQEQLDLYKEAILTMLGVLADKGIILSGVKDE